MDSLIYFGDSIKALDDNGKVGGYLVRFSDDGAQKDLSGEYFTSKTFLGSRDGDGVDTVFHHGQALPIKAKLTKAAQAEIEALRDHVFAPVKTKRDAVGVFAETVLDMADEYEKAVFGLVKAGKIGWSSGAVGHLVKKADDGQITRWPIGEASFTPTPCEPQNRAITIKSLDAIKFVSVVEGDEDPEPATTFQPGALAAKLNQHIADIVDDGHPRAVIVQKMAREAGVQVKAVEAILSGADTKPADAKLRAFARVLDVDFQSLKAKVRHDHLQTIKGMFEEALAEATPSRWELESIYSRIVKKLANAASAAKMAGVEFDLEAKMTEATNEYTALLLKHALGQIAEWMADGDDDDFYLKALTEPSKDLLSNVQLDLEDHSDLLVSGLKSVVARFRGNHEKRVKAGRVLSEKNRARLMAMAEQVLAVGADMKALLDESQPMASEAQKRAAQTAFLRNQWRTRQLGVRANG